MQRLSVRGPLLPSLASAIVLAFLAWLVYLAIELAQHVRAWPF